MPRKIRIRSSRGHEKQNRQYMPVVFTWLGDRDSNPNFQGQNLTSYH